MLKGNKGEWSEIYAFCYLLSQGILRAADKDLNPTAVYFPILKIIREELSGTVLNYFPCDANWKSIRIFDGDTLLKTVNKEEFETVVAELLEKIPEGNRAFEIPSVNDFFSLVFVNKLKADSAHKQDIDIQIHDIHTGISPVCGFSIKSYLGAKPTLINPGKNTNIAYNIIGCSDEIAKNVNRIETRTKIIDRVNELVNNECVFEFDSMVSTQFQENLQFIDLQMPIILAHALLIAYRNNIKKLSDVIEILKAENPLKFSNTNMYEYKFKKFLCAAALGMTPERHWEGEEDANGGYIVVKQDGSVVCYHIYNRTDFEQYLYDYTCFDSPSTTRYEYAQVYNENNVYKIKFNLQVRFR